MGKIYIYSAAMFPEICVQIRSYSWRHGKKQSGCFYSDTV